MAGTAWHSIGLGLEGTATIHSQPLSRVNQQRVCPHGGAAAGGDDKVFRPIIAWPLTGSEIRQLILKKFAIPVFLASQTMK